MRGHRRHGGYSLIEIVVVIGIIAVIGAVSVAQYNGYRARLELKAEAEQLAAALREARSTAMQFADGAQPDATALGRIPRTSQNQYVVYAVRNGVPAEQLQSGTCSVIPMATTQSAQGTNWGPSASSAPRGNSPPTGAVVSFSKAPVGAVVKALGHTFLYGQDGSVVSVDDMPLTAGYPLDLDNGSVRYRVTVSPLGQVTITQL